MSKTSRRDAIKKGLLLGSLPYVAPMIVGSARPASAQPVSGFGCSNVPPSCEVDEEDIEDFLCGPSPACLCFPTIEGSPACILGQCTNISCDDSGDCEPGFFCVSLFDVDDCEEECDEEGGLTQFCVPGCGFETLTSGRSASSAWPPFAMLR